MSLKNRSRPPRPNLSHPLMGADPLTLTRVMAGNGPVPGRSLPLVAAAVGSSLARLPFTLAEQLWVAWRRRHRPMPAPVFIVGHWRSGTTHLYNLLSRSSRFGFVTPVATGLPWDFLILGRLLRPLLERALPEERFIDRIPVKPDSPQEDEIALASMQGISFYHGLYFPRRLRHHFERGLFFTGANRRDIDRWQRRFALFMEKLSLAQPGKRLLIKNPVYSTRIGVLHRIWPEARFIHIYRNPYVVYQSTRNFYARLLEQFALQPYQVNVVDGLILETYPRIMDRLHEDAARLPSKRFSELRFETFEQNPLEELERVYGELAIEGFSGDLPDFENYLSEVRDYRKNVYRFAEADNARVREHWARFIDRWGYAPP